MFGLDEENLDGEEVGDEKEAMHVNTRPIKINNLFEKGHPKRARVEEEKANTLIDDNERPQLTSALPQLAI